MEMQNNTWHSAWDTERELIVIIDLVQHKKEKTGRTGNCVIDVQENYILNITLEKNIME